MPMVRFTNHLRRYFADLREVEVPGQSVAEVVDELERLFPGLRGYLLDETGTLRRHVNVFVGEERAGLSDPLNPDSEIYIIQALSGG